MYKYKLHTLLRKLSYDDYTIAMKWIPERLNISFSTFRSWIYAKKDSKFEIPYYQLELLASFFECTPHDLLSTKSVRNLKQEFLSSKA